MKRLTSILLTFAVILVVANSVFSEPYEGNSRFTDKGGRYSFAVPAGFSSQQNAEGFVMVNSAQTVWLVVKSHGFQTFAEFMAQAYPERDGLSPVGQPQNISETGKTFRASKTSPEGLLIIDTSVVFSPYGGGTLIVAFSDEANHENGFYSGLEVAKSVTFIQLTETQSGGPWRSYLSGKHLIRWSSSRGGSTERTDIYLCPSGKFSARNEFTNSSINGSGSVRSNSDGDWQVTSGSRLVLRSSNGEVVEFEVSRTDDDSVIHLNGAGFRVQFDGQCN